METQTKLAVSRLWDVFEQWRTRRGALHAQMMATDRSDFDSSTRALVGLQAGHLTPLHDRLADCLLHHQKLMEGLTASLHNMPVKGLALDLPAISAQLDTSGVLLRRVREALGDRTAVIQQLAATSTELRVTVEQEAAELHALEGLLTRLTAAELLERSLRVQAIQAAQVYTTSH